MDDESEIKHRFNNILKAADQLADAIDHERNMVCQDIGMQMEVSEKVEVALAVYRKMRGKNEG